MNQWLSLYSIKRWREHYDSAEKQAAPSGSIVDRWRKAGQPSLNKSTGEMEYPARFIHLKDIRPCMYVRRYLEAVRRMGPCTRRQYYHYLVRAIEVPYGYVQKYKGVIERGDLVLRASRETFPGKYFGDKSNIQYNEQGEIERHPYRAARDFRYVMPEPVELGKSVAEAMFVITPGKETRKIISITGHDKYKNLVADSATDSNSSAKRR